MLHTSFLVRNWGVTWKALFSKALLSPPSQQSGRCWYLESMRSCCCLLSIPLPKVPPVLTWDKGKAAHSADRWHDSRPMFCQRKRGTDVKTESGRVLCFLKPFYRMDGGLFSLSCTVPAPLSCLRRLNRRVRRHAGLWCDNPCSEALPLMDRHSFAADSPEQLPPCPPPHAHCHRRSAGKENRPVMITHKLDDNIVALWPFSRDIFTMA